MGAKPFDAIEVIEGVVCFNHCLEKCTTNVHYPFQRCYANRLSKRIFQAFRLKSSAMKLCKDKYSSIIILLQLELAFGVCRIVAYDILFNK